MSTWKADVPFPAEDLGTCSGCDAPIGWIERQDNGRRHPVEARGWAGVPPRPQPAGFSLEAPSRPKQGYTLDGAMVRCVEPAEGERPTVVLFETHFAFCPKRDRFRRRAATPPQE